MMGQALAFDGTWPPATPKLWAELARQFICKVALQLQALDVPANFHIAPFYSSDLVPLLQARSSDEKKA
jgi:hypothetical protein